MSMDGLAGNFGDVIKHFVLTELAMLRLNSMSSSDSFCFFDAFGGNYITYNCQSEAKNFYINLNNSKKKLNNSLYFKIMKDKLWGNEPHNEYFGSTKWIEEVISLSQLKNHQIIYNSNNKEDYDDAKKLVARSSTAKKNYSFQMRDAYDIHQDYQNAITKFDNGIILIDPYWKKKDPIGVSLILKNTIQQISNSNGWSILIWMPIYTQRYLNLSKDMVKDIKTHLKSLNKVTLKCELFKFQCDTQEIKKTCAPRHIKGVHIFHITNCQSSEQHFKNIGVTHICSTVRPKRSKIKKSFEYNYTLMN